MKFNRPTLITFTAPTCSGKSYILDHLSKEDPTTTMFMREKKPGWKFVPTLAKIVSTTTRKPREGEVDGVDYFFISMDESLRLEREGLFAELVDFRGVRYGVTEAEMEKKMHGDIPPAVVLEPNGLKQYEALCAKHGWDIFKIYVHTIESLRIKRLSERTSIDIRNALDDLYRSSETGLMRQILALEQVEKQVAIHTDRMLSILGEERRWQSMNSWDAIIPGDDFHKAIRDIETGIQWRNYRTSTTYESA